MATLNPELSKELRRLMRTNLNVVNEKEIELDKEVIELSVKYNHYLPDLASRIASVRLHSKRIKDEKSDDLSTKESIKYGIAGEMGSSEAVLSNLANSIKKK